MSVLILSMLNDHSTDNVISWLLHKKIKFLRLNEDDYIWDISITIQNNYDDNVCHVRTTTGKDFYLSDFSGVWYRRGLNSLRWRSTYSNKYLESYLQNEYLKIKNFISLQFKKIKFVNLPFDLNEKIDNLFLANQCGFNIPSTLITTSYSDLTLFIKKNKRIICKPISFPYFQDLNKDNVREWAANTNIVTQDDLLPFENKSFFPTLFQAYIEKYLEIRVFYLNGECYSMAIFSQDHEEEVIDYRSKTKAVSANY